MSLIKERGTPIKATATHATAAVASVGAAAGAQHFVTNISVSSDKATSVFSVKDGTTVIWQGQVGATKHAEEFDPPLAASVGNLVSVEIDGTAACYANIAGVSIKVP